MRKILVIDDDPTFRLGMSHLLTALGYEVWLCADGSEGSRRIEEERFDLVITDLKLPCGDGLKILDKVKALTPSTGVIIITGYAETDTALYAAQRGCFDYISKPFMTEELLIAIEQFFKFRDLEEEAVRLRAALRARAL